MSLVYKVISGPLTYYHNNVDDAGRFNSYEILGAAEECNRLQNKILVLEETLASTEIKLTLLICKLERLEQSIQQSIQKLAGK